MLIRICVSPSLVSLQTAHRILVQRQCLQINGVRQRIGQRLEQIADQIEIDQLAWCMENVLGQRSQFHVAEIKFLIIQSEITQCKLL